jgi:hypothetical protein
LGSIENLASKPTLTDFMVIIIVGVGLEINFGQYQKLGIKTHPYRFYGHLTRFDMKATRYLSLVFSSCTSFLGNLL